MHFLVTDISSSMFYNNINKFKENFEMAEAMGTEYFITIMELGEDIASGYRTLSFPNLPSMYILRFNKMQGTLVCNLSSVYSNLPSAYIYFTL